MSLKRKTVTGVYWTGSAEVVNRLLQIAFTAVLARLLDPSDFGLIGMALVFTRFVNMIKGMGLGGAVIQKQEATQEELSSIYWLNVSFSLLLAILLALTAPLCAEFYNEKILTEIILILALNVFLISFQAVHGSLLNKTLNFKALAIIDICVFILSNGIAIYLALLGWGIWSLVSRILLNTLFAVTFTLKVSKWWPSFYFKSEKTIPYLRYGIYMSLGNFAYFFTQNIDFILIGKYLGAQVLGYYTIAFNLAAMPGDQVKNILTRVLFPSFAKIQNDPYKLGEAYHTSIKYLSMVLFPLLFGLSAVSKEFVLTIYGEKWANAISIIPLLAVLGIFRGLIHLTNSIILSKGKSKTIFTIELLQAISMILFIGIAVLYFNLYIVAVSYTAVQGFFFFYTHHHSKNYIKTSIETLFNAIKIPLYSSIIMVMFTKGISLFIVNSSLIHISNFPLQLSILIVIGVASYLLSLHYLSNQDEITNFKNLVFSGKDRIK